MQRPLETLPYGVGQRGNGTQRKIVTVAAILLVLGAIAYIVQLIKGEGVTGLGDVGTGQGAPWGLYVVFIVYFMGVGFAGIVLAAMIRLLGLNKLRVVARMAMVMTLVAAILGTIAIIVDVGQPLRAFWNLLRYARPGSNVFGTFTISLAGYLFATLVYLYLDGRRDAAKCAQTPGRLQGFHSRWASGYTDTPATRERHRRASFWLAVAIVPLLVTGTSTLGFTFGLQVGQPGWHSALQAPAFVVLAASSGLGLLIIIAAVWRHALGEVERLNIDVFRWLGNILMVLVLTYIYLMIVEAVTGLYEGNNAIVAVTESWLIGNFAWIFWPAVAMLVAAFVLLFRQFVSGRYTINAIVWAGILVNLAAIGKRYVMVVPSQTRGSSLPYEVGSYAPNLVEYLVVLGLFGLGTLLYMGFAKIFPIMSMSDSERAAPPATETGGAEPAEGGLDA